MPQFSRPSFHRVMRPCNKLREHFESALVLKHRVLYGDLKAAVQKCAAHPPKVCLSGRHRVRARRIGLAWNNEINSWQEAFKLKARHGRNETASIPNVTQHLNIWVGMVAKILPERFALTVFQVFRFSV